MNKETANDICAAVNKFLHSISCGASRHYITPEGEMRWGMLKRDIGSIIQAYVEDDDE